MNPILILGQCYRPQGLGLSLGPKFLNSDFGHDSGDASRVRIVGEVALGSPRLHLNSPLTVSLAPNAGNFSKSQRIENGATWTVWMELIKL